MPHEDLSIIEEDKEFQRYLDYVKGSSAKALALTAMRTDQTHKKVKSLEHDFRAHCQVPANQAHGIRPQTTTHRDNTPDEDAEEGVLHIEGEVKTDRLWGYLKWTLIFVALIAVGGLGVKAIEAMVGG